MEAYDRWEKGLRGLLVGCFLAASVAGSAFAAQPDTTPPGMSPPAITTPAPSPNQMSTANTPGGTSSSQDLVTMRQKINQALLQPDFSYFPNKSVDPFIPFITPQAGRSAGAAAGQEEVELPPEQQRPLTPLQKMSMGEVEKGLKAIVWGDMGRRAVIEDGAGKGYIVTVGTPVGDKNGVVVDIFNDRLVVKQDVWDPQLKRMLAQNTVVKLKKEKEK